MPKKKGKKKKKSASSPSKEDDKNELENGDPGTLIADGTTDLGKDAAGGKKKKGKKKRLKMSKSEKSLEKLEKSADKLKANQEFYLPFINAMDRWLVSNATQIVNMFKNFDSEGECILTYDEFKSGMFDLGLPCNKIELHLVAKLLDRENSGEIDYTDIPKGLQYARELEEIEREAMEAEKILILEERKTQKCEACKMGISEPYRNKNPKYILLNLRLVTFESVFKDHPGHLEVLVHSEITVYGILQIINEKTGILSTKLAVFTDQSRSREAMLAPDLTLKELGYEGDSADDPDELLLYYDYKVEFTECPVLLCDHYFGLKHEKLIIK